MGLPGYSMVKFEHSLQLDISLLFFQGMSDTHRKRSAVRILFILLFAWDVLYACFPYRI